MEDTRLEHVEAGVDHVGGGEFTSHWACEVRSTSAMSAG